MLYLVIRQTFLLLCKEKEVEPMIDGQDIISMIDRDFDILYDQYLNRSTENFDRYYNLGWWNMYRRLESDWLRVILTLRYFKKCGKTIISICWEFLWHWCLHWFPGIFWKRILEKHQNTTLEEAKEMLGNSHREVMDLADAFTNEELFSKGGYPWTGNNALGSYFVSNPSSHYNWVIKKLKAHRRNCKA